MTRDELISRLKEFPPDRQVYFSPGLSQEIAAAKTGTIYTAYLTDERWKQEDYKTNYDPPVPDFIVPVIMISF